MPIDTGMPGSPASIRSAGTWLSGRLSPQLQAAETAIGRVGRDAEVSWQGAAGEAFRGRMTTSSRKLGQFQDAVDRSAAAIEAYAADLETAQSRMGLIRAAAAASGLVVAGTVIQDPVPADDQQLAAYRTAQHDHDTTREGFKLATDTLANVWSDLREKWFFTAADLIGGAAATGMILQSSILSKQATFLSDESARLLEQARRAPVGTPARLIYADVDAARVASSSADDAAAAAARLERSEPRIGLKLGGALAVAGVAYDIANGKPVEQAVVSGAVGFGASVAAGAVIGSFIPVPVVGTAVGALGGAVVGLFASGMVDSLYQNGTGSVGQAIEDGFAAVGDTGAAIGNLAEDAWDAIF